MKKLIQIFHYYIFKISRFSRRIFYTKIDKISFHYFNDHKILLMFNKKSSFNLIYDIFKNELKILKKYFDDNFIKEFIRLSCFLITFFFNVKT